MMRSIHVPDPLMTRNLALALIFALVPAAAIADSCPGNRQVLGTARVVEVNAKAEPRIGRKQFPSTLPLHDKELVLTFDDGPWPGTTARVLDALKSECVRATFFLLGRNTAAHPELATGARRRPQHRTPQLFTSAPQPYVAHASRK